MSTYAYLCVGLVAIADYRNGVDNEVLALFRDDMLKIASVMAREYYAEEDWSGFGQDEEIITAVYSCPASTAADRLDLMGATTEASLSFLDDRLAERAFRTGDPTNGRDWIKAITSASDQRDDDGIPKPGSKQSLLDMLDCRNYREERYVLRCALLAFSEEIVTLDVTDLNQAGWLDAFPRLESMASKAAETIRKSTTDGVPVVVLTEA